MTSREWSELKLLAGIETVGEDRRDLGIVKLAIASLRAAGVKGEIDIGNLLPNPPEKHEQTGEDMYAALKAISNGNKVNRNAGGVADT